MTIHFQNWIVSITIFKGTVSIISSDPPCKDGNSRFTTVPFKGRDRPAM